MVQGRVSVPRQWGAHTPAGSHQPPPVPSHFPRSPLPATHAQVPPPHHFVNLWEAENSTRLPPQPPPPWPPPKPPSPPGCSGLLPKGQPPRRVAGGVPASRDAGRRRARRAALTDRNSSRTPLTPRRRQPAPARGRPPSTAAAVRTARCCGRCARGGRPPLTRPTLADDRSGGGGGGGGGRRGRHRRFATSPTSPPSPDESWEGIVIPHHCPVSEARNMIGRQRLRHPLEFNRQPVA